MRPQYVIKADDDSFVMLSELEARLRLEWYTALEEAVSLTPSDSAADWDPSRTAPANSSPTKVPVRMPQGSTSHMLMKAPSTAAITRYWAPESAMNEEGVKSIDPMVYWGCKFILRISLDHAPRSDFLS